MAVLLCVVPGATAGRTLYAPDATGSLVYAFPLTTDGVLLANSFTNLGAAPQAVAMSPDGSHLYVATTGTTPLTTFDVSPGDGSLTAQPAIAGPVASALAATPSGSLLFAANASGSVSGYSLSAQGTPTALPGSFVSLAGVAASGIAISPDGGRLYVTYEEASGAGHLADFAIGAGGTLLSLHDIATGQSPREITLAKGGARLYVSNAGSSNVSGFAVGAEGALSPLPKSPYGSGSGPDGIAATPDGTRILVANAIAGSISSFTVSTDGSLTPAGTNTAVAGASAVAISPDGSHAYIGGAATVRAFYLAQDAVLTANGQAMTTSGQHSAFVVSPNQPPVARFVASPAPAGSDSVFDGSGSTDADGNVARWHWDFGDGETGEGASAKHAYAKPGTYLVRLTVTDNEGCSIGQLFTGQTMSCAGGASTSNSIVVPAAIVKPPVVPPCIHDGNDGYCGTADEKAPVVSILGISDGASITTLDAPQEIVGTITPDPSGIKTIQMRFTKADGTAVKRATVTRKVCRRVRGNKRCNQRPVYRQTCKRVNGKRRCHRKKLVKVIDSKVPMCLTISGTKTYLVRYQCSKVPWITVSGESVFRYSLPVALGVGSYSVDVIAVDGAGNADVLDEGRNHMAFKIIQTPSNQGSSGGGSTGSTTTAPSEPINDTGSPFAAR